MLPEYIWYNRSRVNDATRAINGLWLPMQYTNKTGNEAAAINAPTQNMVDMYEKKVMMETIILYQTQKQVIVMKNLIRLVTLVFITIFFIVVLSGEPTRVDRHYI